MFVFMSMGVSILEIYSFRLSKYLEAIEGIVNLIYFN